jgi:hypothetical protein
VFFILQVLPKLKVSIKDQIKSLEQELARIGEEGPPDDVTQKGNCPVSLCHAPVRYRFVS